MNNFEDLPLNATDVLNNISLLIGAARALDGSASQRELSINIIEFVDMYVAAAIEEMKARREK
ncbi:TPA: hypothetical protein QIT95_004618 [Klebsiella michiganensis]|nr:hypothetical protein [Klebsiella michiganensis]HEP0440456.1 hypothetical protein [Klebsiella michiganensis]HEP0465846.1 hypothetical protein [Klebsiella michiganensis]